MATRVYDDGEIAARLKDLPRWSHVDGAIRREFKTASFKATLMLATTVGHLCESAWHHPEMVIGFSTLLVKLSTHKPKGITDRDFALAERIEQVVGWRPPAGGALTGPPDDPRHVYLKDEA